ncbi:MAG: SDR family oxidoreductase [Polyangiaceae bacterium]|nr:SDR family oxidoreductase [Polyangiaceae bacterium]
MTALRGKCALVTGAGQRVGAAIARALGEAGMRVAVHFHQSREGAALVAQEITQAGGEAQLFSADLSKQAECDQLVDSVLAAFGGLDTLVLSAANFDRVEFTEITAEHFERALGLNLLAPFRLAHRAAPALSATRGSIVFITCSSARTPYKNHLPYVVSKGALSHLTQVLALELAPLVRVNAVAPGTVLPPQDMSEAAVASLANAVPLRRTGTAEDIAQAVLYLAQADFVTGQELSVDGGRSTAKIGRF